MFFFLLNRYTQVQTNAYNNKTEILMIESQTKYKTSIPHYFHVKRQKI